MTVAGIVYVWDVTPVPCHKQLLFRTSPAHSPSIHLFTINFYSSRSSSVFESSAVSQREQLFPRSLPQKKCMISISSLNVAARNLFCSGIFVTCNFYNHVLYCVFFPSLSSLITFVALCWHMMSTFLWNNNGITLWLLVRKFTLAVVAACWHCSTWQRQHLLALPSAQDLLACKKRETSITNHLLLFL